MAGKRAHVVEDSEAVEAALGNPDAGHASGPATVDILSTPQGDPAGGARSSADGAQVTDNAGSTIRGASLAFTGTFEVAIGSDTDTGNLHADGKPSSPAERPTVVTEALTASALPPEGAIAPEAFTSRARPAAAVWDASEVVTEIYTAHYKYLVRLAVMLVHDVQTAEEVVQEAFEAMHLAWRRLRDKEKALAYLRQAILNKSRSELRHRKVVETHAPKHAPDEQSAEHAALTLIERSAVISALRALPVRQREAIVLRYYGGFSEADIAKTMGISKGAVKSHTARAMSALKSSLEQGTQ